VLPSSSGFYAVSALVARADIFDVKDDLHHLVEQLGRHKRVSHGIPAAGGNDRHEVVGFLIHRLTRSRFGFRHRLGWSRGTLPITTVDILIGHRRLESN
jgi:hypothetical protein